MMLRRAQNSKPINYLFLDLNMDYFWSVADLGTETMESETGDKGGLLH